MVLYQSTFKAISQVDRIHSFDVKRFDLEKPQTTCKYSNILRFETMTFAVGANVLVYVVFILFFTHTFINKFDLFY